MLKYNDYSVQQGYHYIFKVQDMISTKRMLCLMALLTPQQQEKKWPQFKNRMFTEIILKMFFIHQL